MSWTDFGFNLLSEFIATLAGIILGIPAGIWLNNLIEKKRNISEQMKEEKILEKLKIEILTHLEDEINLNVIVLKNYEQRMPEDIPYVSLKTSTWRSLTVQEKTLLLTKPFYKKIFNLYFMFEDFIKNHSYIIDLSHRSGTALPIKRRLKELIDGTVNLITLILNNCNLVLHKMKEVKNKIDD